MMFTPSGERSWAHGWDPRFPSPGADETDPGTVFQTSHDGRESIWVVARCNFGRSIEYVTATPGERCGLVAVTCERSANGTKATVNYDLTSLSREADAELDRFAANYPSFLSHWENSIGEAIKSA